MLLTSCLGIHALLLCCTSARAFGLCLLACVCSSVLGGLDRALIYVSHGGRGVVGVQSVAQYPA